MVFQVKLSEYAENLLASSSSGCVKLSELALLFSTFSSRLVLFQGLAGLVELAGIFVAVIFSQFSFQFNHIHNSTFYSI